MLKNEVNQKLLRYVIRNTFFFMICDGIEFIFIYWSRETTLIWAYYAECKVSMEYQLVAFLILTSSAIIVDAIAPYLLQLKRILLYFELNRFRGLTLSIRHVIS